MIKKLKEILGEAEDIYIRVPVNDINEDHELIKDLGLDSLGRVSLFHEINFELNIEAEETDAANWKTVGDILNYMQAKK